jgi:integrase
MEVAGDGSAYVFVPLKRLAALRPHAETGLPISVDPISNVLPQFKERQAEAETAKPHGTLHDLRKSWCTFMAGIVPMHVLKEWAGHTDIATTARYHARTTEDDAARLRRALSA